MNSATCDKIDDNRNKDLSDCSPCRRPDGFATECDGLEVLLSARTIGTASGLASGLLGKGRDKAQNQALGVAVCGLVESNRHLDVLNELLYLRLWKTEHQPSQRGQESVLVAGL